MAHILETIRNTDIKQAKSILEIAHAKIVSATMQAQSDIHHKDSWGINLKRLEVKLPSLPGVIGKESEKLVELVNILATVERTLSALSWLAIEFSENRLRECHPSTSDDSNGNDIVMTDRSGNISVRCEVCDVASSSAGQNGKEKKDIRNLGCTASVPSDGVRRFIATSQEFSTALTSPKRKWNSMPYKYIAHDTNQPNGTVMLEVVSSSI